jgi:hypothetical protein
MKISDTGADKPKFGLDHGDQRIGNLLLADGLGISENPRLNSGADARSAQRASGSGLRREAKR